jgi:hypothetical protein
MGRCRSAMAFHLQNGCGAERKQLESDTLGV